MCKRLMFLVCCVVMFGLTTKAPADLLVHYAFDETSGTVAADASGNGFDGTVNADTNWVAGYLGGALRFTGDGNVTIPAASMEMYSEIGSVAFWMNAGVPTGINTMFWGGDNVTGTGFGPENEMHVHLESAVADIWTGGELSFFAIANPNVHVFSDPSKGADPAVPPVDPKLLGDLEWHHVAAVWDGGAGVMQLYVDGEFIAEKEYVATGFPLTNIFLGMMGSGNRRFIGMMDDFRLYSNPLSEAEVFALFQNQGNQVEARPVAQPQDFVLLQNYPNPFNPTTTISYQLAKNSDVLLAIYNQAGQKVRTLVQEPQGAGFQSVQWNGRDGIGQLLGSGVYLCRLQVNDNIQTIKLVLMK